MANGQDISGTGLGAYKRSFGLDQYGKGRSELYAAMGKEEAFELGRYEYELKKAEDAAKAESESSSLWSTLGSIVGAGIGLATGGPAGAYKGYQVGKEVGKWGQNILYDYDASDYAITTDPGKFDVEQRYALEDINRQFEEAEDAQFWKDVAGTGTTAFSMFFDAPEGLKGEEWWEEGGGSPDWLRNLRYGEQETTSPYTATSIT